MFSSNPSFVFCDKENPIGYGTKYNFLELGLIECLSVYIYDMTMLFVYYQYTEQAPKQTLTFIFDYLFIYFLVMKFHLQIQSLRLKSINMC